MAFQRGEPRPPGSGRKKGQKNKRPTLKSLQAAICDAGFDTGQELVTLYREAEDEVTRLKVIELVLKYTQPLPAKPTVEPDESAQEFGREYTDEELEAIIDAGEPS